MAKVYASAEPEKRLFISLLTRDISLADAFLDLVDNSVNAALVPFASQLKTADDYWALARAGLTATVTITIHVDENSVSVEDNAGGIDQKTAKNHVFKFGHEESAAGSDEGDRLSVYGIGLKRAIFKLGNKIDIISDHKSGGFTLDLDVRAWESTPQPKWRFEILPRKANPRACGTKITVTQLRPDVKRRINDGTFIDDLTDKLSQTYSFFIGRFVNIILNKQPVEPTILDIDKNFSTESYESEDVTYSISAGLAKPAKDGTFKTENAGWFVFCNGRNVVYANKAELTGWGMSGYMPLFQPKHRPFLGLVFFVAVDPESLPWTTTKASINQESAVWQEAKRKMAAVGREVSGYLDRRYKDDGVEVSLAEIAALPTERISMMEAAASGERRQFQPPKLTPKNETSIQYKVKRREVDSIRDHLGRRSMSNSDVGRYTFDHFLANEVED